MTSDDLVQTATGHPRPFDYQPAGQMALLRRVLESATGELRDEPPDVGGAVHLTPAEQSLVAELVADGLSIQDKFRPEPLYKQTGKA